MNPTFCFFHIEKCMGTSLRRMLYDYFKNIYDEETIYIPENKIITQNLLHSSDLILFNDKNFNVILCHCAYNKIGVTDFSRNCFSITCIREPLERFLSHYYYFMNPTNNLYFYELDDLQTIDAINMCCPHLLCTRLSGDTNNYEDAINNIKTINCILIMEQINEDIIYLNNCLHVYTNTNHEMIMIKENVNNIVNNDIKILDLKKLEQYIHLFENDLKLYNYVCNMKVEDRFSPFWV